MISRLSRMLPYLARVQSDSRSLYQESTWQYLPSANILQRHEFARRISIQTEEPSDQECADTKKDHVSGSNPSERKSEVQLSSSNTSVKFSGLDNLKTSIRHDLAAVFTCKVCETRSMKTFCRESYEKGVVVVRCAGCDNLHLLADRLGWFGEPGSVEDLLAARGEELKKGSVESLNLTLEDLAGRKL